MGGECLVDDSIQFGIKANRGFLVVVFFFSFMLVQFYTRTCMQMVTKTLYTTINYIEHNGQHGQDDKMGLTRIEKHPSNCTQKRVVSYMEEVNHINNNFVATTTANNIVLNSFKLFSFFTIYTVDSTKSENGVQ